MAVPLYYSNPFMPEDSGRIGAHFRRVCEKLRQPCGGPDTPLADHQGGRYKITKKQYLERFLMLQVGGKLIVSATTPSPWL
jgi:hypothetical protein